MSRMQAVHLYWGFIWSVFCLLQVTAIKNVTLSHDGPVVLGGTITFRADLYKENGERPSGTFKYKWADDAFIPHRYETKETSDTTTYWSINYPRDNYTVGIYEVEVIVSEKFLFWFDVITSHRIHFSVTEFLNGNISIVQSNKTVENTYVSSASEAKMMIALRKGDLDFLTQKATAISTYWFIDCKYYGQTNDLSFVYNFTNPNVLHTVEALVVASYDPPTTTTVLPPTTTTVQTTTTPVPNATTPSTNVTTAVTTTPLPTTTTPSTTPIIVTTTAVTTTPRVNNTDTNISNISLPYICSNSSIIPPDPNKTYGHFQRKIDIRAPITNVSVEGTNWIQPWDMLSLNVTCKGSGPFNRCLHFYRGDYNITGNETCDDGVQLHSCNFSILHYFLEPSVYTILVILKNDVSNHISRLTINIYKVTTKPQLSVIVVPVSCSLVAIVLIIFGVAYYIQNRARFTVEVADFDFGQNNPEMEYKTFTERLRDSINNAVRPGGKRISGYKPLSNPETLQ